MSEVSERVTVLRARLLGIRTVALAASQGKRGGTPTGEHWRWECRTCDAPLTVDPLTAGFLKCPTCGHGGTSLRSVEEYAMPGDRLELGPLPSFALPTADEVPLPVARHIELHDPATELAVVEALVAVLGLHDPGSDGRCRECADVDLTGEWRADAWPCRTVVALLGLVP